jgi:hypothetical protein
MRERREQTELRHPFEAFLIEQRTRVEDTLAAHDKRLKLRLWAYEADLLDEEMTIHVGTQIQNLV